MIENEMDDRNCVRHEPRENTNVDTKWASTHTIHDELQRNNEQTNDIYVA